MPNNTGLEPGKIYKDGENFISGSDIINSNKPYRVLDGAYDGDPSEYVIPYPKDAQGRYIIPIPTFTGNYTYNGNTIFPVFNGYEARYMYIDGQQMAKVPGTYTVTFTLSSSRFVWADLDDSHVDRDVDWYINQALGELSVQADTLVINDKYGTVTIEYEAHTSNLQFVSNYDKLSASCSNGMIYVRAEGALNGNYEIEVIAPSTGTHSEARLTLHVQVAFTQLGEDLYLTQKTVAYGDQFTQNRWSKIYQTIDTIGAEVGYQSQGLGKTIDSLSRVKITADETKAEAELLCHYDKNGEGADAVIRLTAITNEMAGKIKAHSQIYMAADWIKLEGYTTINGSFQIADSSTVGYNAGDIFFKNAYLGEPGDTFIHITKQAGKYGMFGDYFDLYEWDEYIKWGGGTQAQLYPHGTLDVKALPNTPVQGNVPTYVRVAPNGINFITEHGIGEEGAKAVQGLSATPIILGGQLFAGYNFRWTGEIDFSSSTTIRARDTYIYDPDNHYEALYRDIANGITYKRGDDCQRFRFSMTESQIPSVDGFCPPLLTIDAVAASLPTPQEYVTSPGLCGVWHEGRLIVGYEQIGYENSSGNIIAPKASINGTLLVSSAVRCNTLYVNDTQVTSDRRKKTDIEDLDERYIKLFDELDVKRFKWVDYPQGEEDDEPDTRYKVGLIAQDVIFAADKCGLTKDEQGFVGGSEMSHYSLDYQHISMIAIYKMKQMEKEYENRISTLEAKIDTLLREKGA